MKYIKPTHFDVVSSNLSDDELALVLDDKLYTTITKDTIKLDIKAKKVTHIVLFGLKCDSVNITISNNTMNVIATKPPKIKGWIDYCTHKKVYESILVIKVPVVVFETTIGIELIGASVSLGKLVVGQMREFGITIDSPSGDFVDFSTFDRQSGVVSRGLTTKDIKAIVQISNDDIDNMIETLTEIAGLFCIFFVIDNLKSYTVYGVVRSANQLFKGADFTTIDIKIEGMI